MHVISLYLAVSLQFFFIDLEFKIIPNEITFSGIILAFLMNIIFPELIGSATWVQALLRTLVGFVLGGGILFLFGVFGKMVFKKEAMGMGDVKLMAMFGAFYGYLDAFLIIIIGSFFGAFVGGICLFSKKLKFGQQIPFGPFLALASFIVIFWGDEIVRFYLRLVLIN